LILTPRSQIPDAPVPRYDRIRAYILKREQHEGSFMHARVGYLESGLIDDQVAQQQEVEVQRPGPVALAAHAAVPCFQGEQLLQQLARRKRGSQHGNGVDEVRLVPLADRRGSIKGGARDQLRAGQSAKLLERLTHVAHWIVQIAAKPDMRNLRHRVVQETGCSGDWVLRTRDRQ